MEAYDPYAKGFEKWLLEQRQRRDRIGGFAYEWFDDTTRPRLAGAKKIVDYLLSQGVPDVCIEVFQRVWKEYCGEDITESGDILYVLLHSQIASIQGGFPWHFEPLHLYRRRGPGEMAWQEVFRGTSLECAEELEERNSAREWLEIDAWKDVYPARPEKSGSRNVSKRTRYAVLERDKFHCRACGRGPQDGVKLEVDHHFPHSRGGTDDMDNLRTLCFDCNRGKFDRLPPELSAQTI
jgi:5-methylcytosine-specific restriction endonuclease McrA/uncharacterized protein YozE (UPF0346 family)